nr:hypothetical protein [Tanacetum cinerariifolium]
MTNHNNTNHGDQTPPNSTLKLCDGISPIAVMIYSSGVGVSGGVRLYFMFGCLIEDHGYDVGLSMLLVDFKNAFNLVDQEVMS